MPFKNFFIFSYLFSLFATIFNLSIVYNNSVSLSKTYFKANYFSYEVIEESYLILDISFNLQLSNSSNNILKSSLD